MSVDVDQARWFDIAPNCHGGCGKPAQGIVRGPLNENLGFYCARCGVARVAKAQKAQAKLKGAAPK